MKPTVGLVLAAKKWVIVRTSLHNAVNLVVAPDGAVWLKNRCDGIYRFDGIEWNHFAKDKQLGGIIPEQIMVAPDGALWFFSYYGGWARYKP